MKAADPLKIPKLIPKVTSNKPKDIDVDSAIEPYLPPRSNFLYTLVIDLDETLVHYAEVNQR